MKKPLNFILSTLLLILCCSISKSHAQNNVWNFAPQYLEVISQSLKPLPAPGGAIIGTITLNNYQPNQQTQFMHNSIQDAKGELLFFVVDGAIYDKEGYIIAQMNDGGASGVVYFDVIGGYVETLIVPVPGNCQQYYIISANSSGVSSHGINKVYYSLLDLSQISLETGRPGALLDPLNPSIQLPWVVDNTFDLSNQAPNFSFPGDSEPNTAMAVTDLTASNERYLFINGDNDLFRFDVTANGITYSGYKFPLSYSVNSVPTINEVHSRSEMEIVTYGTGYRLAMSYPNGQCNSCVPQIPTGNTVLFADINASGNITSTSYEVLPYVNSSQKASIKGMEFSPNGDYVYITHDANNVSSANQTPFKIYDVSNQSFLSNAQINNPQMLSDIDAMGFSNSQIELGYDGLNYKLYLVNGTNVATIENVNNPLSGLNWTNSIGVSINYNLNTYNLPTTDFEKHIYILGDQVDGMNYIDYLIDPLIAGIECCKENSSYDVFESTTNSTYEFTGNQNWDGTGTNPWNWTNASTLGVTIKDKMIIKSGADITIDNMRFEFAPEAQLIIEDDAKLTINGCILTADVRCDPNAMWHGVEVWGNGSFQPATSGRFIAQNNSVIEHAMEATANYRHDLTISGSPIIGAFFPASTGGIIQLTETKLRNNQFDVFMETYQSSLPTNNSPINDQSRFIQCEFVTDNALNNPVVLPIAHAYLNNVNGIRFLGCTFHNTDVGNNFAYMQRGSGIEARDSKFTVTDYCPSIVIFPNPCPNPVISQFNNLTRGVRLFSVNPLNTCQVTKSSFYDNWRGVILRGVDLANVSDNTFDIGMNNSPFPTQSTISVGLGMRDCDGYKVENNAFSTSFSGHLGCGIINSGTGSNEIYKNTFTDLVVGTQTQEINGDGTSAGTGLEFRCNKYINTSDYDILVATGLIKAFHGTCGTLVNPNDPLTPSNNEFSYTAQFGDFWMTNNTTPPGFNVSYQMAQDPNPLVNHTIPRDYPNSPTHYNPINTNPTFCTNITYDPNTSCPCPVNTTKTISQLQAFISTQKQIIEDLLGFIDGGDTQELLNLINTTSGGTLKSTLLDASPYLSDDVLIAYIATNPSTGNLKQLLLANSPLSEDVVAALGNINIPQGHQNQINSAQEGTSEREELEVEITYHESLINSAENDIMRQLLFDDSDSTIQNFNDVADFIENDMTSKTNEDNQLLVNALMADKDYTAAQQKLAQIHPNPENADFCKLNSTLISCQQYPEKEMVLLTNTGLQQNVNEVAAATTNEQEVTSAKVLREVVGIVSLNYTELFDIVVPTGNSQRLANNETKISGKRVENVELFPNPNLGQFIVEHDLNLEYGVISLVVYDLIGKVKYSSTINGSKEQINIDLPAGIYIYTIEQNQSVVSTDKLIIQ